MTSQDTGLVAKPKKIMPRWQRIAWFAFGIIMLGTGLLQIFHGLTENSELPACDSQRAKDALSDVFKEKKLNPTSYGEIKTIASAPDLVQCEATLPAGDQGVLDAKYSFIRDGSKQQLQYSISVKPQ